MYDVIFSEILELSALKLHFDDMWLPCFSPYKKLLVLQVSKYIKGGWIQRFKQSSYRFPNAEKALADAVDAAGPTLGPVLLSMSEYLMSSFNESYQSRCIDLSSEILKCFLNSQYLFCFVKYQDCLWICNPMWISLSIWNEPFHVAPLYNLKKLNHERFPYKTKGNYSVIS